MKLPNPISEKTFNDFADSLVDVIKRRESASVLNLSEREQPYRINQFLNDKQVQKKIKSYQIITLNLLSLPMEDPEDLDTLVNKLTNKKKEIVLFILGADKLLDEKYTLVGSLNSLPHRIKNYSLIFFFRRNITYPNILKKLSFFSNLFQNIVVYYIYEKPDNHQFITYLEAKFNHRLPPEIAMRIEYECGGNLWLIKQAFRYFIKTRDKISLFNHEEMNTRLKIIWNEFENEEKELLKKLTVKDSQLSSKEEDILNYFLKIRLVNKENGSYQIMTPLLKKFIIQETSRQIRIRLNEKSEIIVNQLIVDSLFSRRERKFIKFLLQNSNKLINREKAASVIWGENFREFYTDWALDQVITRVRNKIVRLGLDRKLLVTKKNQGFMFYVSN